MANYEQGQTTNATPLLMHVVSMGTEAGTIHKEIHWSAFTSATECANGEATLLWAKNEGAAPVVKLNSCDTLFTGYGGALSVTAAVSGNDCQVFATGLAGKTINWSMLIESDSLVVSP